jgi:hypothetical protein
LDYAGADCAGNHAAAILKEKAVLGFVAELWAFLRVRKKYWLMPVLIMVVVIGGLLVLANGSVVAPFIYTLF